MRVFIFRKVENKIREIAAIMERPPQFVINMILNDYLACEDSKKKVLDLLKKNQKKYENAIESVWEGEGDSGGYRD